MKKNIFVAFGGKSPEHDVSCITGLQVIKAVTNDKYNVYPLYIAKNGKMYVDKSLTKLENLKNFKFKPHTLAHFKLGDKKLYFDGITKSSVDVTCVIQCFHGGIYEGGAFSALLEMCCIPYTSTGIVGGAVGMDKELQKRVAKAVGVEVCPYVAVKKNSVGDLTKLFEISKNLIVKPNDLGSSIGVSKVANEAELTDALALVYTYSDVAIVERFLENFYELNISAFEIDGKINLSAIEKPKAKNEILTFEDKYLSKSVKTKGMKNLTRELPAVIDIEIENKLKSYAKKMYETLRLSSVCRFDFLVENGIVYFNEVNTIPGSIAFYLWENRGVKFNELVDHMIEEAIKNAETRSRIIRNINTKVLNN
ncbi:MAG: hypothetical protein RR327_05965 [Clostridia bacterium]